jgi:hypothetical protein
LVSDLTVVDQEGHGDFYLVPLAEVGEIPQLLGHCIEKVVFGNQPVTLIYAPDSNPERGGLLAAGYETSRPMSSTFPKGEPIAWTERLLVIRSYVERAVHYRV